MFQKKTWEDRITEYPARRTLTQTDGTAQIVTVARSEGSITQEGDAFSAENMNDLEGRIEEGFTAVNKDLADGKIKFGIDADGNYGYIKDGADTVTPFKPGGLTEVGIINYTSSTYGEYKNYTFNIAELRSDYGCLTADDFIVPYSPVKISAGYQYGSDTVMYKTYDNSEGTLLIRLWNRVNTGSEGIITSTAAFSVYML